MQASEKQDIHRRAMKRFDMVSRDEQNQRTAAIEDTRFAQVEKAQWDNWSNKTRRNRPKYSINKIALPLNQAIGDQRQTRISVKVRPKSSGTDEDIAKTYAGLIRNIEMASKFNRIKDNAFKEVVNGGIGAWYIATEYCDDDTFEQDIVIKKITSAASSVYLESANTDDNKKGAMWGFVIEEMSQDIFKQKWPDAITSDFETNKNTYYYEGWRNQDTVRVADYYERQEYSVNLARFTNGKVYELTKKNQSVLDELEAEGITIEKSAAGNEIIRKVKRHKVLHYKLSGAEILEGPNEWAGQYIPIIMIYGYNLWIKGKHFYRGMVRHAKDPQRVYNYATSAAIEATAESPKDPFWVTPKQMNGFENQFETFNTRNTPFMQYNPDPQAPGPPARTGAPTVQSALIQQISQADIDIQSTTGRFAPSLGDNPADQSGRAVIAVQQQGEAGTYELTDNLAGGVEYTGEILLDLIPRIYDTSRQIRILNPDGTSEVVEINKTVFDTETQTEVILNDLSQGKYNIEVDTGPSYKTQRTESLNFLNALQMNNPAFQQISPDLLAKNIDFEFSEELEGRMRKMLIQQGVIEPNEKEAQELAAKQPQPNPADLIALESMKLGLEEQAARIDRMALENEELKAKIGNTMADTDKKLADRDKSVADKNKIVSESGIMEINSNDQEVDQDIRGINKTVINELAMEEQQKALEQMNQQQQQMNQQQEQPQQQPQQMDPEMIEGGPVTGVPGVGEQVPM